MKHKKSEILGDSERDKLFGCMMGFVVGNKSCAVLLKAYCLCGFEHLLKPFSWQKFRSFIVSVINFTGMPLAHRYVVSLFSSQKHIPIYCDIWCYLNVRVSGLLSKVKTENDFHILCDLNLFTKGKNVQVLFKNDP